MTFIVVCIADLRVSVQRYFNHLKALRSLCLAKKNKKNKQNREASTFLNEIISLNNTRFWFYQLLLLFFFLFRIFLWTQDSKSCSTSKQLLVGLICTNHDYTNNKFPRKVVQKLYETQFWTGQSLCKMVAYWTPASIHTQNETVYKK